MAKQQKKYVSTIPLSMRGKKRYILFQVHSGKSPVAFTKSDVEKGLYHHFLHAYGTLGMPTLRYKFIAYNPQNRIGILRIAHTKKNKTIAALLLMKEMHAKPVVMRTLQTSGSLKSLRPRFDSRL